jgi:hypothetical protein
MRGRTMYVVVNMHVVACMDADSMTWPAVSTALSSVPLSETRCIAMIHWNQATSGRIPAEGWLVEHMPLAGAPST